MPDENILEEESEIILDKWLKENGESIKEVYFNRKNKINSPTFQTQGVNKKPDLIIEILSKYNGIQYIAVEVKTSQVSKNIHDSSKIIDYYENYVLGNTKYFINNSEIKISYFLVATESSPKGKLFFDDSELKDNLNTPNDQWRVWCAQHKFLPRYEYNRTNDFTRNLWSQWRRLKLKIKKEHEYLPAIGILISEPLGIEKPHIQIQIWKDWLIDKKAQWRQTFEVI